ncbi:MAG: cytochrome c oxidase subunit II [Gemmatimonadota bacterium]
MVALASCSGPQSALDPGSREAEAIADLAWLTTVAGAAVFVATVGAAWWALRRGTALTAEVAERRIVATSAVATTLILAALLVSGLLVLRTHNPSVPPTTLRVEVTGEQWWWRVRYMRTGQPPVESANEIRLPVGQQVEFLLQSADVIHSFWVPSLGGKIDMTPGRRTRLVLTPTMTGVFRGVCAEFCGESHALMAMEVEVLAGPDFANWLAAESRPVDARALTHSGHRSFLKFGCGACHVVRGTFARGVIGPDLTHIGSRRSIGAGIMPNDSLRIAEIISDVGRIKPGARMPSFAMIPRDELNAIATWLGSLK